MGTLMTTVDKSHLVYGEMTTEEWHDLLATIEATKNRDARVKVHGSIFWYFLEVLPPRFQGCSGFVFAEGADDPTWFGEIGDDHYARRFASYEEIPAWANRFWVKRYVA